MLTVRFSMDSGGRDGFIDDLFVRAASRRRGVASALLAAALCGCESRGLRVPHVETAATNLAAVSLYRLFELADRQRPLLTRRLDGRRETALSADPS